MSDKPEEPKYVKRVILDQMPDGTINVTFKQRPGEIIPHRIEYHSLVKAFEVRYFQAVRMYQRDQSIKAREAGEKELLALKSTTQKEIAHA